MRKALIIIDMQSSENPEIHILAETISTHIRESSQEYEFCIFTRFIPIPHAPFEKYLGWIPDMNREKSHIIEELQEVAGGSHIIEKSTYSAFKNLEFQKLLDFHEIDTLVLCGRDLDACVLATAYEAFDLGYQVEILFDLCFLPVRFSSDQIRLLYQRNIAH